MIKWSKKFRLERTWPRFETSSTDGCPNSTRSLWKWLPKMVMLAKKKTEKMTGHRGTEAEGVVGSDENTEVGGA